MINKCLIFLLILVGLSSQAIGQIDPAARGLAVAAKTAASQVGQGTAAYQSTPPSAVLSSWGITAWTPSTVTIYPDSRSPYGNVGITPEALFDLFSTARSNPGSTFYVNINTGNDTNAGTTAAAPFLSIYIAVGKCNAAGLPCKIFVTPSTTWHQSYPRQRGFSAGVNTPTVDTAFISTGGRVNTGTYDEFANPTVDSTYTNCYSWSQSSNDEVVDTVNLNRFGNYVEFKNEATAALANSDAGSGLSAWAQVSNTIYVCRGDHAAVTFKNTHVLRSTVDNFVLKNQVNIFIGGATPSDGWDLEGGNQVGVISTVYSSTTLPATQKALIGSNISMRYDGGIVNTNARGFGIDSIHGLAACFNCRSDGQSTDGFNLHHTLANTAISRMLTVNSTAFDNGRYNQNSQNAFTNHEDTGMIDVAGISDSNRGGSLRSVGASFGWFVGTICRNDLGDLTSTVGIIPPTCVSTGQDASTTDATRYWLDGVRIDMPGATTSIVANPGTSVLIRNMHPLRAPAGGTGNVGTY